jgi:uncharacterized protein YcaQ
LTIELSREAARRYLVARHGLAPPRSLPSRPESVMTVIERLGVLQFDPLEVPGARNHDLVLHARIAGYQRGWCEQWLYGPDRRLFEIYNKSLNMVPIEDLPHYRLSWARYAPGYGSGVLREHADVVADILSEIEKRGPLSTADFAHHSHTVDWWWAPTRASRAILEALFVVGRVGVARRTGNRRYYDLIERLVPADILARTEPAEEAHRHRLFSRYKAVGLSRPGAGHDIMIGTEADRRSRQTREMVEAGTLLEVRVEGHKPLLYAPARDAAGLAAAKKPLKGGLAVAFIAPLDPLVWDRTLVREVFGFDYLWEVYTPEHKRRFGYYVLPILFGDRLVGRIEPRFERTTKTLRILGLWWEDGISPRREVGLVDAVRDALRDYAAFVGATSVEWLPATGGAARLFGSIIRRKTYGA